MFANQSQVSYKENQSMGGKFDNTVKRNMKRLKGKNTKSDLFFKDSPKECSFDPNDISFEGKSAKKSICSQKFESKILREKAPAYLNKTTKQSVNYTDIFFVKGSKNNDDVCVSQYLNSKSPKPFGGNTTVSCKPKEFIIGDKENKDTLSLGSEAHVKDLNFSICQKIKQIEEKELSILENLNHFGEIIKSRESLDNEDSCNQLTKQGSMETVKEDAESRYAPINEENPIFVNSSLSYSAGFFIKSNSKLQLEEEINQDVDDKSVCKELFVKKGKLQPVIVESNKESTLEEGRMRTTTPKKGLKRYRGRSKPNKYSSISKKSAEIRELSRKNSRFGRSSSKKIGPRGQKNKGKVGLELADLEKLGSEVLCFGQNLNEIDLTKFKLPRLSEYFKILNIEKKALCDIDGYTRGILWEKAKKMRIRDQKLINYAAELNSCTFKPKVSHKKTKQQAIKRKTTLRKKFNKANTAQSKRIEGCSYMQKFNHVKNRQEVAVASSYKRRAVRGGD